MNEIEVLKQLKTQKNLSYEKMAKELGVSWRTLYRWLNGQSKPSDLALMQIKKYLNKHEEK